MKKLILLSALFVPLGLGAQNMAQADKAYDAGNFTEALNTYKSELKTAQGDNLYKAQLRTIASQYMLGQYMNAAQSAFSFPLPTNQLWQARFLLYRIQTAKRVKNIYRAGLPSASEDEANLPQLSKAQWNEKINQDYETLWALRHSIVNAPTSKETLILNIKDTDTQAIPTLFDFVVLDWKEYLLSGSSPVVPLRAADALTLQYTSPAKTKDNAEKLLSILAEAAKLDGKNRADARLIWQTQRLTLPFEESRFFTFENKEKERQEAAQLLKTLSGYATAKKGFLGKISNLLKLTKADYGKAYATLQAAQLLNTAEEYAEAVALCDWAVENLTASFYTQSCAQLATEIRTPVLNVQPPAFSQDPQNTKVRFSTRNIPAVHTRLYSVTQEDLKNWYKAENRTTLNSWRYLTNVPQEQIKNLLSRPAIAQLKTTLSYEKPHAYAKASMTLPALPKSGFYVAVLSYDQSFDSEQAPVQTVVLNNTDLALFVSAAAEADPADFHTRQSRTFTPNVFRIYTLNLKTGEPEAGADVTYYTDWKGKKEQGKTNENGLLSLPRKLSTAPRANNQHFILPKAEKNDSTAFTNNQIYFNLYHHDPIRLFAETDRAVYRPGQTIQLAVYGFEMAGRGLNTLPENTPVSVTVRDTNYEKVYSKTLRLNAYGTATDKLILPETGLLGHYSVETIFNSGGHKTYGYASFRVDEYKRPEYEITLSPAAALQYDKEATITGEAKYYFGAPLSKASVKYTVTRQYFTPRWFWWFTPVQTEKEFIVQGETLTEKDGSFSFSFTPQAPQEQKFPSAYTVHAEVADASGRVIETSRTYNAARKAVFFNASFDKGFYDANTASPLATVKLTDVNSEPAEGKFTAEIYQLENILPQKTNECEMHFCTPFSLENTYGNNKELRKVSAKEYRVKKGEEINLQIPVLSEGIYKLKLHAKNADNTDLIFLVTEKTSGLKLPAVAIAQHPTYYPGTQAKLLIGADALRGKKRIEVYDDGRFLALRELTAPGATVYSLPIQNHWRGGVYLRWFGASDYQFYTDQTFINVPYDNKELAFNISVPETVKPGEKVNWAISVKNAAGAPVQAQASVRVYDKSLDYYAKVNPLLNLENLFPQAESRVELRDSDFIVSPTTAQPFKKMPEAHFQMPQMPNLDLQARFVRYGIMNFATTRAVGGVKMAAAPRMAMAKSMDVVMEESAGMDTAEKETGAAEPKAQIRTDFAETAYFNPTLPITGGKGSVHFTMPQNLTAWNVMAFALTKQADFGTFTTQTLTRKDITVRLSLPRFWREKDQSTLVAQVTNLTNKKRQAEVTLDLTLDGQNAASLFGIEKTTQSISIPAGGTTAVTWSVNVPEGVGILKAAATVRSGKDTDAEAKEIPLLPAQERLAESMTIALESGRETLKLDNLLTPDSQCKVSAVTLRVDPSLMLSVFGAMPQLLRPTHTDALSVADRYVPLAVVNAFYKTYPMLSSAVTKLPKPNTQTSAWDNTDPARLTLLEETPWLPQAQGGAERTAFLTDLFDPAAVEKARTQAEKELAKYQTASGGYSWLPGGEASEFITLNLLSSYAEALRYGGEIPQEAAKKALAWLGPRIEKNLKKAEGSAYTVAHALYAAYVFTAFPQEWKEFKSAHAQNWLDYADKYSAFMTPLGQAYAAAAYYRLDNGTKAQNYLDLVLSQMKTDPVAGSYFAPEAQSWLWYNDTLRTQTATLRTLLEVRPESSKAAGLVKWLLFNRKAEMWNSSTATAEAIYALLDYMRINGLLDDPAEYSLVWGAEKKTLHFEPFDWSEKLAWTQEAQNVSSKFYTAEVTKRGGLTGFVTLDAVYTTPNAKTSPKGVMNIAREYLLKYTENGQEKVRELLPEEEIPAGSEVEVRLSVETSSAFDFVVLMDPKPAGFESTELLSGWTWDALPMYRENRDASTKFFFNRVPAGKYTLRYTLRPTLPGTYHALPAQMQSMYAPEFSAHTASNEIKVK